VSGTYEAVIGLEVHAQLDTHSKLFCGCATSEGAVANTFICPICLGHPGTLPVINQQAVRLGVMAALATSCTVHERSVFARKQYFYPDLPKGYQISQFDRPLATDGKLHITVDGEPLVIGITRIHLEEDAAKSSHDEHGTHVDYNRGGTPLAEIVSEPDMRSPAQAEAYLRVLHRVLVESGVTKGDMEKGHFRCDANVSIRKPGEPLGTRAEIKNINSFKFVAKAIQGEIERQEAVLNSGGRVVQETRGWRAGSTFSMRSKESSSDYRYFPDPDLPPLEVTSSMRNEALSALPAAPMDTWLADQSVHRHASFRDAHGLDDYTAGVLLASADLTGLFEAAVAEGGEPVPLANWIQTEVQRKLNEGGSLSAAGLTPKSFVDLLKMLQAGDIGRNAAKEVFDALWQHGGDASSIVAERGLKKVGDEALIRAAIEKILKANPNEVAKYQGGNKKIIGFFMGQVMRATRGQADPALARRLVVEELDSV